MGKRLVIVFMVSLLLFVGFGCSPVPEEDAPLRMALIPAGEAPAEIERYTPIMEYLSEYIGREIEPVVATSYTAVIVALEKGDIDIARFGAFSYILAAQEAGAEIIVRGVKESTGMDAYHSLIIARADSGIESVDDLKGSPFGFVDVASASGYLIPYAMLLQAGVDPEEDFSELYYAGSHPSVIEAVKAGHITAGAIADNRWEDALAAGVIEEGELIIVASSDPIPMSPEVVRAGLDPELKALIQEAYLKMPHELAQLAVGGLTHYVEARDEDYNPLREVARLLDLDLTELD